MVSASTRRPDPDTLLPVFVYGTLRTGQHNAPLLAGRVHHVTPAHLPGVDLHDAGGYPFAVPTDNPANRATGVVGELVYLTPDTAAEALAVLDQLEGYRGPGHPGNLYDRVRVTVLAAGRRTSAWVYLAAPPRRGEVRQLPRITSGDWTVRQSADHTSW